MLRWRAIYSSSSTSRLLRTDKEDEVAIAIQYCFTEDLGLFLASVLGDLEQLLVLAVSDSFRVDFIFLIGMVEPNDEFEP